MHRPAEVKKETTRKISTERAKYEDWSFIEPRIRKGVYGWARRG